MITLVTLGPTQEPLDAMRVISNRSSGKLGTQLALHLARSGHQVIALRGSGSTYTTDELLAECHTVIPFTTTEDLGKAFEHASHGGDIGAVFHAAAVSDFYFPAASQGKIPSDEPSLTLTLKPTPKLLPRLRSLFPKALVTGWKFEARVEGIPSQQRKEALAAASLQIANCGSDACVLNGPAYGEGFGHVGKNGILTHLQDAHTLCAFLAGILSR